MDNLGTFIGFAVGVMFVVMGLVLKAGKGLNMIAGYNTLNEEDKKNINGELLGELAGNMLLITAGCIFVITIALIYDKLIIVIIAVVISLIICLGGIIYGNTSPKFKK